ncbi:hypothetical protein N7478_008214 [Penicillium angulare]|uniref:uncharacterized protein n=1 Tax=Penicillium angulare TaxID=116970 RepID=UPI00254093F7|nr:uncharacterized protein N7478_008214 [Penicillium angulare]KAJ5273089.1 hypothetical protein N7478_008214 [Penicillium angulare]
MFAALSDERATWKVASKLEKRSLLFSVNCLAGLAIFSFGYDQGCFMGDYVSDRFGRIKSFAFGAAWGILGAALQCTAINPTWMIVSRLINGVGTGILNATVPVYGSELADYESRGMFIAMEFTLNIVGVEAMYVLERLRGSGNERAIRLEMSEIEAMVELEAESEANITYFQMLFGTGQGDLHIARPIFKIAGFDSQKTMWISGLNNIFYACATLICVVTLDRIGRRWTLWWGAAGQVAAMFLAGGMARGGIANPDNQAPWGIAATSMVYLYTFVFGATWLTVPWLYPAEIFPLKVRAKGNAWSVAGWSVVNGSLTLALPYVFAAIGENTLHVFGAVNLISIPIVWAFYPEPSQRNLEEIDMLFISKSPFVWDAKSNFARLMAENPHFGAACTRKSVVNDPEKEMNLQCEHEEIVSTHRN